MDYLCGVYVDYKGERHFRVDEMEPTECYLPSGIEFFVVEAGSKEDAERRMREMYPAYREAIQEAYGMLNELYQNYRVYGYHSTTVAEESA